MTAVSLVLANFNQAHLLRGSVERLERTLARSKYDVRFILIDDGSVDATWSVSQDLAATRPSMRLLRQKQNQGRGRCISDGVRAATTELVATLDTDLEVEPFYLLPLLDRLRDPQVDLALARRWYPMPLSPSRGWELSRWFAHRGYRAVTRAAFGTAVDTASGCKVLRRSSLLPVLDAIEDGRWFWDTELVVRAEQAGLRISQVDAYCAGKPKGKSTVALVPEIAAHLRLVARLRASLARDQSDSGKQSAICLTQAGPNSM